MAYKSEHSADELRRMINTLAEARSRLQKHGAFEDIAGLKPEHETWISGYATGGDLTAWQTALQSAKDTRNAVQAAIGSAIAALEANLAALEI